MARLSPAMRASAGGGCGVEAGGREDETRRAAGDERRPRASAQPAADQHRRGAWTRAARAKPGALVAWAGDRTPQPRTSAFQGRASSSTGSGVLQAASTQGSEL